MFNQLWVKISLLKHWQFSYLNNNNISRIEIASEYKSGLISPIVWSLNFIFNRWVFEWKSLFYKMEHIWKTRILQHYNAKTSIILSNFLFWQWFFNGVSIVFLGALSIYQQINKDFLVKSAPYLAYGIFVHFEKSALRYVLKIFWGLFHHHNILNNYFKIKSIRYCFFCIFNKKKKILIKLHV